MLDEICPLFAYLVYKLLMRREKHHFYVFELLTFAIRQVSNRRQMVCDDAILVSNDTFQLLDRLLVHVIDLE